MHQMPVMYQPSTFALLTELLSFYFFKEFLVFEKGQLNLCGVTVGKIAVGG